MRIILCNLSGVKQVDNKKVRHLVKAGSRWPMTIGYTKSVDYYPFPFYLAYATAILKRDFNDIDIQGIDGVANDYTDEELYREISKNPPEILVTEVTLITLKDDLLFLKKIKRDFGCKIIITGVYVSSFQDSVLVDNSFIDFAIYGEYELSLKELINCLIANNSGSLKDIHGLLYRDGDKRFKNPHSASINDLDMLPFPDRIDFPPTIYADFAFHSPCISMIASRGCPAGCVYCVERHVTYDSPKYRTRDYKSVVDEMVECISLYGARQFYFDDQSFVVSKKFVRKLCEEIISRKLNIPWTCMGDAMFVDYDTLKIMSDAGCIGMKFGVESANKDILKNIGKPLNTDKAIQVVKWCKELGIITHATFCIGLPGDTEETINETVAFVDTLRADSAQVSKVVPYPGTPMFKWAKENNYLVTDNLDLYDGAAKSVLSYPHLPSERIDYWYEKISKNVARKKIITYLKHPQSSFEIIYQLYKQKGCVKMIQSLSSFVSRGFR